ncbi:MAG: AI-2E family transporter, partial [Solirubrobacteraceae bacterium]
TSLRGYFVGVTVVALFNAVVIGLGALLLGVPLAGSIAVVNFVAAYIPYLGAWTAGAFTVLVALGEGGASTALTMGIIVLLANGALQQLIQPIAYGAALGIHPLAVLIVTIAGGALFGTIGLIVAAPITSAVTKIASDLALARAAHDEAPATAPPASPASAPT